MKDDVRPSNNLISVGNIGAPENTKLLEPLKYAAPEWKGLPISLNPLPGDAEFADVTYLMSGVAVAISGRGERVVTIEGRDKSVGSAPFMFDIYESGLELDRFAWKGEFGEIIVIPFDSNYLRHLLHEEYGKFSVATHLGKFDHRVSQLAISLWKEAESGHANGALYSQGLTLSLIGILMDFYGASRTTENQAAGNLSAKQIGAIKSMVLDKLEHNITVEDLSEFIGMSPRHFSRLFKSSFGSSPHDYVVNARVEKAMNLMKSSSKLSLAEIADQVGFSSQAHFSNVFARKMKVSPGIWRRANI